MSRVIKFRAWDTKGDMKMCADFMEFNRNMLAQNLGDPWNDERFVKMQFTGLKDKNGKEIYEGDIMRTGTDRIKEIKWNDDEAGFNWFNKNGMLLSEIIGNIYESPELLKI